MGKTVEKMKNPWEEIELSDYENHMKLDSVMQLQCMNNMMKKQFNTYPVKSVMVLGIAGGNGLEHIDTAKINKVYGVDINDKYLDEVRKRYDNLKDRLECICVDLTDENVVLPHSDMVIANLIIEYIGYKCFSNIIKKSRPMYVSCIIQVNEAEDFVSDSPYVHVFDDLDKVYHHVDEEGLIAEMNDMGYCVTERYSCELPNGKSLLRLDFKR